MNRLESRLRNGEEVMRHMRGRQERYELRELKPRGVDTSEARDTFPVNWSRLC